MNIFLNTKAVLGYFYIQYAGQLLRRRMENQIGWGLYSHVTERGDFWCIFCNTYWNCATLFSQSFDLWLFAKKILT